MYAVATFAALREQGEGTRHSKVRALLHGHPTVETPGPLLDSAITRGGRTYNGYRSYDTVYGARLQSFFRTNEERRSVPVSTQVVVGRNSNDAS
jgi:hypothetical protein